jgi:cytochrome b6-f complex iron-sulfur subunit
MSAIPNRAELQCSTAEQEEARLTRRGFLNLAGKALLALSGLLGLGGLLKFLSYQPDPAPPTQFELGSASDYPPGSRTVISEARAVLLHGESGFTALSLVCPHLGCTVGLAPEGYACPCHGSRFTPDGSVDIGPASQAMRPLTVEETPDGKLILHTDS